MKVLIVDDHSNDRALLRGVLVTAQHEVWEAGNGIEALSVLEHQRADIVISDILMPQMDGYALCRKIRGDDRLKDLPHLFYTGAYTSGEDEIRARAAGSDGFLIKPAPADVLLKMLQQLMEDRGPRPALIKEEPEAPGVMHAYNGTLVRLLGQKNAELIANMDRLARVEERLRLKGAAIAHVADAVVVTDLRGTILWTNPAFSVMTGFAADEAVGQNPRILQSGRHDPSFYQDLWQTILAGRTWRGKFTNRRKDGTFYQGEQAIAPVRGEGGEITHFVGVMNDITSRTQAEAELNSSERKYRLLFESHPLPMWVYDHETLRFLAVNAAAVIHYGYTAEEFLSLTICDIRPTEAVPDLLEWLRGPQEAVATGAPWLHRKKDGTLIEVEIAWQDLEFAGRRGRQVLARDVTARRQMAKALEKERALLRTLIDQVPDFIYVKDREGRFVLANQAVARVMGVARPSELIGRTDGDFFPAPVAAKFRADEQAVLAGTPLVNQEETTRAADGTERIVLTTKRPLRERDGQILSLVGVGRDVTAPIRAQAALLAAENRYRMIFERSPEGLYQTTPDGRFLSANPALAGIVGYDSPAELIASHTHCLGYTRPGHPEEFNRLMAAHSAVTDFEYQVRRKDGEVIWVSENVRAIRGPDGGVVHYEGSLIDITGRKRAAEEKARLGRQMELLLESTGEGIYGIDCDGRCTFINRAGAKMIEREPAAVLGQEMHGLVQHQRADRRVYPAAESPILTALRRGEHCETNADVFWRAGGTAFPVEYRSNPIRENGAIIGAVVMFTDITEKKKLETEALRTQRIESIGRLASGIAHDMNNILAPIMMSAPLLRMALTPKDVEKTLATIETSAKRGADLVKQLLTFGRGVEGDRGPVAPEALIREIMRIAAQTFPRSITFITTFAPGGWSVCGDASQLHQVLLNLLVNARDAMPQGGTLTVATANVQFPLGAALLPSEAPPGPYVRLSVADTGTGISPDIVDKVFDPFFTTKEVGLGTGLGLSTLLGVVKSHGGFVRLSSEVSRGSTFEIYLPATPGVTEKRSESALPPSPSSGNELILVVDDEESICNILRETLAHQGYRVVTANDGAEASAIFARDPTGIELVISDLDMPVLDGLGLVKVLRRIKPEVKVIISSGAGATKTLQKRLEELRALQVDAILNKPYSAAQILSAIASALASKPPRSKNRLAQAATARV